MTRLWWHPWVLAAYPPVHLYVYNVRQAFASDLLVILSVSLLLAGTLWALLTLARAGRDRRALAVTLLMALFFAYGPWQWLRAQFFGAGYTVTRIESIAATIIFSVAFVYAVVRVFRSDSGALSWNRFLNAAALALVAVGSVNAAADYLRGRSMEIPLAPETVELARSAGPDQPSIIVVMLDAYGGADALLESYGHDNTDFVNALRDLGFSVADAFHSNYPFTEFSVATLLNMRYELHPDGQDLDAPLRLDSTHARLRAASASVRDSVVARELRQLGYRYITFETGFSSVEIPDADEHFEPVRTISDLEGEFINQTMLSPLLQITGRPYERRIRARDHRRRVQFTCDTLLSLEQSDQPQFVWAHLLLPHQPFVFDAHGNPVDPPLHKDIGRLYHDRYREQLVYTNTLMLDVLERLTKARPDAIILVLGDHGPRYLESEYRYEWDALARDIASTLFAVRAPEGMALDRLTRVQSHANVFRALFADAFDVDLPPLPDVSFIPAEQNSPEYVPVQWDGSEPRVITHTE